ncbi:membrane protein [Sorangium cellulosum]|uniref:Membrane protein n=1 Tax=Sorangium cellulosum TaxID=56 RepID=A0A2L0F646_SORCE|nr:HdeD family acid-resistance protein [Sorangium cellulosum]AUX46971.1 membrane protein [Sorangium cellulosum]
MISSMVRNWWVPVVRGVLAMIFGVLAIAMPQISLYALVLLFGGYALAEGVTNLLGAARGGYEEQRWWVLLLEGIVSIGVALITLLSPGITAVALVLWIGAWAVVTGVLKIAAAVRLRKLIEGEWLLGLAGVLSIAVGVLLFIAPKAGALALVIWIGAYALVFGVFLIALGLRMRSLCAAAVGSGAGPLHHGT